MARVTLGLLFVCLFAGISHSEGGKCELKNGKSLAVDESYSDDDQCKKYNCKSDGLEEESCSRPDPDSFPDKKCQVVEGKGSFPNCCPQVSCPKGADMKQIRFIDQRRKRNAESAPAVAKRMPDQILVKRFFQPSNERNIGGGLGDGIRKVGDSIGCALKGIFGGGCKEKDKVPPVGPGGRPGGFGNTHMGSPILMLLRMIGSMKREDRGDLNKLEIVGTDKIGRIDIEQFRDLHDLNLGDLKGMLLGDMAGLNPTGLQGIDIEFLRRLGLNVDGLKDMNDLSVRNFLIIWFKIIANLLSSGANLGDLGRLRLGGEELKNIKFETLNFGKLGELTARDLHLFNFGLKGEMEGWGEMSNMNMLSLILICIHGYRNVFPGAQIPQIPVAGGLGGSGDGSHDVNIIKTKGELKYITDPEELKKLKEQGWVVMGDDLKNINREKLKEFNIDEAQVKKLQDEVNGNDLNLGSLKIGS